MGWRVGNGRGLEGQKDRGLEGWMFSKKSEKRRGQGVKKRRVQGFEDSRGQVVLLAFFSKHKSKGFKRSSERSRGLEG